MKTKLTVKMDQTIIHSAKQFAEKEQTSLSRLIEDFFTQLTSTRPTQQRDRLGAVGELMGILRGKRIRSARQYRKEHIEKLIKKYE